MSSIKVHIVIYLLPFFFNDTATTEIYTLSLHDALPICFEHLRPAGLALDRLPELGVLHCKEAAQDHASYEAQRDRKSTRLNSSHSQISYAVFCLKKTNRILFLHSLNSTT